MGINGCGNLLQRHTTLSFKMIIHLTKTRHEEVKHLNLTYVHPMVGADANLTCYREPNGMDPEKCVESIASFTLLKMLEF